ncbi:MAG: hypothetical protein JST42_28215 [Bacteroidetes bacterium]|nr:hypothetical protein [Bacteroidota bacterium]
MISALSFRRIRLGVTFFFFLAFFNSRAQAPAITVKAGLPARYDLSSGAASPAVPGSSVQQIVHGNGIYLAGTINPPTLFRSADGNEWSRVFTGPNLLGKDTVLNAGQRPVLAFGGGRFVLAADSGQLFSSPDGLNWTSINLGTRVNFHDVEYFNGVFNLVGDSLSYYTSTDGVSWTRVNTNIGSPGDYYDLVLSGNGYLVLDVIHIDTFPVQIACRSTTGPQGPWTADTLRGAASGSIRFLNGHFYKVNGPTMVSTDAHSWTTLMLRGSTISTFDAFADSSKVYLLTTFNQTDAPPGIILPTPDNGATFGDSVFVTIVGEHGAFINHNYFVYGTSGISGSQDGIHYHMLGSTGSKAAAGDSNYVKIGANPDGSYMYSSRDFVSWTPHDSLKNGLPGILFDGTRYLAEGPTVYSSPDGGHWSVKGTNWRYMDHFAFGGGVFVGYSSQRSDSLWYSTDGVIWQPAILPDLSQPRAPDINLGQFTKIRYANGRFILLTAHGDGDRANMLVSSDGIHFGFGFPNGIGSRYLAPRGFNDIVYDPDGAKYYLIGTGTYPDGTERFFSLGFSSLDSFAIFDTANTIRGLPDGTILSLSGEASFSYSHGHFVGAADDFTHRSGGNFYNSYLLWSTDGLNWDSHSIGGSTQLISNLASGDVFRMEGTANYELMADFSPVGPPPPSLVMDFDARAFQNSKVLLSWRISAARDVRRFVIQRSTGTAGWDSIGVVAAQRGIRYRYVDNSPLPGDDAYRLAITDSNGSMQYSPVRHVHLGPAVTVYPNPVRDVLTINAGTPGHRSYVLTNGFGRVVRRTDSDAATLSLFMGNLPPGIYTLFVLEQGSYPGQLQIIHY